MKSKNAILIAISTLFLNCLSLGLIPTDVWYVDKKTKEKYVNLLNEQSTSKPSIYIVLPFQMLGALDYNDFWMTIEPDTSLKKEAIVTFDSLCLKTCYNNTKARLQIVRDNEILNKPIDSSIELSSHKIILVNNNRNNYYMMFYGVMRHFCPTARLIGSYKIEFKDGMIDSGLINIELSKRDYRPLFIIGY